jgi:ABC-type uncharacterized transport system permease subunit
MRTILRIVKIGLLASILAVLSIFSVYWRRCDQELPNFGFCSMSQAVSWLHSSGSFEFWFPIAFFSVGVGWVAYKVLCNKKR